MYNVSFGPSRQASIMARLFYLFLGAIFTAVGFVGVFLPVLPTTPFLILAMACFARSSKRFEKWLLSHSKFGPLLQNWRERGAIPVQGKWMALTGCIFGFSLFLLSGQYHWSLVFLVAIMMVVGLAYVWTRPSV